MMTSRGVRSGSRNSPAGTIPTCAPPPIPHQRHRLTAATKSPQLCTQAVGCHPRSSAYWFIAAIQRHGSPGGISSAARSGSPITTSCATVDPRARVDTNRDIGSIGQMAMSVTANSQVSLFRVIFADPDPDARLALDPPLSPQHQVRGADRADRDLELLGEQAVAGQVAVGGVQAGADALADVLGHALPTCSRHVDLPESLRREYRNLVRLVGRVHLLSHVDILSQVRVRCHVSPGVASGDTGPRPLVHLTLHGCAGRGPGGTEEAPAPHRTQTPEGGRSTPAEEEFVVTGDWVAIGCSAAIVLAFAVIMAVTARRQRPGNSR